MIPASWTARHGRCMTRHGRWTRAVAVVVLLGLSGLTALRHGATTPPVRTVILSQRPRAVALDTQTGLTFVATAGAGAREPGQVSLLATATGVLLRTVSVGLDPTALAVDERAGRVLVVNHQSGSVSVLDARSGRRIATVPVGLLPRAVAVDERRGCALIVSDVGRVSLLDTRRATVLRAVAVGLSAWDVAVDEGSGHAVVVGTRLDRAGQLRGSVSLLDVATGRVLYQVAVGLLPRSVVLDTWRGRAVVFNADNPSMGVLDTRRGLLLRTIHLSPPPAAAGVDEPSGRVFVLSDAAASLRVLAATTGQLLATVAVGPNAGPALTRPPGDQAAVPDRRDGPASMLYTVADDPPGALLAVDGWRGRVIVASTSPAARATLAMPARQVSVVDARSGAVLRTIPFDGAPVAVAVDELRGRAVVLTSAGAISRPVVGWDPWGAWACALRTWLPGPALLPLSPTTPRPPTRIVPAGVSVVDIG